MKGTGGMKKIRRVVMAFLLVTPVVALSTAGPSLAGGEKSGGTYAIILPSSKSDGSFGEAGYTGLQKGAKAVDGETQVLENVQVADAEEAFRNLAADGPTVVIGLGGQFADAGAAVAPEFPDVHFVVINGTQTGDNLSSWSLSEGEVAYLAGVLVADTLQPAEIGRVAGIEIPPLKFATAGFADGARSVNPDIEYFSTFTGDMDDVALAKEASLAAFNGGAEVLYVGMNNGTVGQEQAAQEAGGLLVHNVFDKCDDPDVGDVYYGTAITDPIFAVKKVVTGIGKGKLKPGFAKSNLETTKGFLVKLCDDEIPAETQTKIDEARDALNNGDIEIGLEPKE
jgi:basic membrane protein A